MKPFNRHILIKPIEEKQEDTGFVLEPALRVVTPNGRRCSLKSLDSRVDILSSSSWLNILKAQRS